MSSSGRIVTGNIGVVPGAWEKGRDSDVLYTRGIGSCIGIAIYDAETRVGHMAHIFSTSGSLRSVLQPMLESVQSSLSNSSNLIAHVTGGSSESKLSREKPLRTQTITHLASLSLEAKRLIVDWNEDEQVLVGIALNCANGELEMTRNPISYRTS